jgi:tRNA A-37 threonylcarbamoyl transferase component Bud32
MLVTQVDAIVVAGESAWCKRYGQQRQPVRLWLLRVLARVLKLDPILPPTEYVGIDAQHCEMQMIAKLQRLGVRVPRVLSADEGELVLSDLGPTLSALCKNEADPHRRYMMVKAGFDALTDLHRRGGYLNQAFARNMTLQWMDGRPQIGFIDFEQDPAEVMSMDAAQARDLLLYSYSTAYLLADDLDSFVELFQRHVRAESDLVQRWCALVIERLCPAIKLCGLVEKKLRLWRKACTRVKITAQSAWMFVCADAEVLFDVLSLI